MAKTWDRQGSRCMCPGPLTSPRGLAHEGPYRCEKDAQGERVPGTLCRFEGQLPSPEKTERSTHDSPPRSGFPHLGRGHSEACQAPIPAGLWLFQVRQWLWEWQEDGSGLHRSSC